MRIIFLLLALFPTLLTASQLDQRLSYTTVEIKNQFSTMKNESFEGLHVEVLNTNSVKILVKPYMSMNLCTNEDQSTCNIQSPIYLYKFDNEEKIFNELKNRITNPN